MRDDLTRNSNHLSDPHPMALLHLSARMQSYGRMLEKLELERIDELQKNGPTALMDHGQLLVTLLRDGKEKLIQFGEYFVNVTWATNEETLKKFKLDGPADDGVTYFMQATPNKFGPKPFAVWVSKEEADILRTRIKEIMQYSRLDTAPQTVE